MENTPKSESQPSSQRSRQRAAQPEGQSPQLVERGREGGVSRFYQNPFATMFQLSREMDRLIDSFFGRPFGRPMALAPTPSDVLWAPEIDVRERNGSLVVSADVPGVKKEEIRVEVTDGELAISGERREERAEGGEEQGYRHVECSYGRFYRAIPLPEGARPEEAKASMHDGVLEIVVPLEKGSGRKQIPIQ